MPSAEVQAVIDELAEHLKRSVVIDDPQLGLLYNSAHFGDEDPVRVEAMLKRRTNSKAIGYVMSCGVMAWTRPGVIPANDDLELRARVCVPVRWQGELLALIMVVDADGSMTTAETMMVSSVAEQLAPILVTELQTGDQTAEQTVLDLVHDDGALRRAALEKLAAAEASSGDELAVTAIRLSVRDGAVDASQAHIKVALRSALKLPGLTAARFQLGAVGEDGAVLVIGSGRPLSAETTRLHAQHMVARVNDLSSGRFVAVAGIGPSVEGLNRAHETAELAALATRAAVIGLTGDVTTWDGLGPYGPLLRIPSNQLSRHTLPAEVQRLLDIDADGNLVKTLRAFLDHAASAPEASEALHIHRTTLYYRISRIEELLGIDLSDGRTRLSLHIGISLLDLIPDFRREADVPQTTSTPAP